MWYYSRLRATSPVRQTAGFSLACWAQMTWMMWSMLKNTYYLTKEWVTMTTVPAAPRYTNISLPVSSVWPNSGQLFSLIHWHDVKYICVVEGWKQWINRTINKQLEYQDLMQSKQWPLNRLKIYLTYLFYYYFVYKMNIWSNPFYCLLFYLRTVVQSERTASLCVTSLIPLTTRWIKKTSPAMVHICVDYWLNVIQVNNRIIKKLTENKWQTGWKTLNKCNKCFSAL